MDTSQQRALVAVKVHYVMDDARKSSATWPRDLAKNCWRSQSHIVEERIEELGLIWLEKSRMGKLNASFHPQK